MTNEERPVLELGDRVSRECVGHPLSDGPRRRGTVVGRYTSAPQRGAVREDWILYEVRWDDAPGVAAGYMREGLRYEEQSALDVYLATKAMRDPIEVAAQAECDRIAADILAKALTRFPSPQKVDK